MQTAEEIERKLALSVQRLEGCTQTYQFAVGTERVAAMKQYPLSTVLNMSVIPNTTQVYMDTPGFYPCTQLDKHAESQILLVFLTFLL